MLRMNDAVLLDVEQNSIILRSKYKYINNRMSIVKTRGGMEIC